MAESYDHPQAPARTELLLDVLAKLSDYVAVWDPRLQVIYANDALRKLWNAREEDYLGKTLAELPFSTVDPRQIEEAVRRVFDTRQPVADGFPYKAATGEAGYAEFVCNPLFDKDGKVAFVAGVARDATARRRAEDALQESERQYRLLFDSIDQGFCLVEILRDAHGRADFRHLKTNPAFERETGIAGAEGRLVSEVVPGLKDRWGETWLRVARTGVPEHHVNKSPALGRWFDTTIYPVDGSDGKRIAFLFSDITQQKTEELELQEADRRKDEFLATLAHELRNPLAAIRTSLEVIMLAEPDSAIQDDAHETIERQSRQLVALVDDLLEVSRIKQGKIELNKQPVILSEILKGAVEAVLPMVKEAQQDLSVDLPPAPVQIFADPYRLAQVFTNLLNNASKYTPARGQIRVNAAMEPGKVIVSVSDTGMGISKDMQERIFEMFVQVHRNQQRGYSGLGLGLTLTRSLVEMHGGTVEVESAGPGEGSTFHICLPIIEAIPKTPGEASGEVAILKSRTRILVVDDNAPAAKMLSALINILGCEAASAYTGKEALELAEDFRPDIILMDLGMPEMDGFEAAREIRRRPWGAGVTLVALTGWGQDEDKQKTREAGFDLHWVKPVELRDVQRLLAEQEHHEEGRQ